YFPFAGRDWPLASLADVWNGLGPYMRSPSLLLCKTDSPPGWNIHWANTNALYHFPTDLIQFPSSYYYYAQFYHNIKDAQHPGPAVSMPLSAVLYPAQKAVFQCAAGKMETRGHQPDMLMLGFVDGHSQLVPLARLNPARPSDPFNFDWTIGGLA